MRSKPQGYLQLPPEAELMEVSLLSGSCVVMLVETSSTAVGYYCKKTVTQSMSPSISIMRKCCVVSLSMLGEMS